MGYYVGVEENVKIYIEDINPDCNKAILFLHGWPGSHELFEYQFDVLPRFGYRCIGIDTRGFGASDKPWNGYDYSRLADDVRGVIDTLQLRNITLVGHSTGGGIAVKYMSRHNGYGVSKLVLCAAAAPSLIKRTNFPYGIDREVVDQIIEGTYTDRPKMLKGFGDIFFHKHITEALSDWFFKLGLQAAGWSTAAIANTWLKEVLFTDLEKINVPTLIIHGIYDKVVPFSLGEIQEQYIKGSRLVPFVDSGHASFYDEKDKFNEILTEFVE